VCEARYRMCGCFGALRPCLRPGHVCYLASKGRKMMKITVFAPFRGNVSSVSPSYFVK